MEQFLPSVDAVNEDVLSRIETDGFDVPMLLVWGYDDPSADIDLGMDLFDRISDETADAQMHIINRAGHFSFREHPEKFNAVLRAFCL